MMAKKPMKKAVPAASTPKSSGKSETDIKAGKGSGSSGSAYASRAGGFTKPFPKTGAAVAATTPSVRSGSTTPKK
jgi:hypothetical protein